jgi:hypothetical protein
VCYWEFPGKKPFFGEFGSQFRACESQLDQVSARNFELMYHTDRFERPLLPVMSVWVDNCRFRYAAPKIHVGAT